MNISQAEEVCVSFIDAIGDPVDDADLAEVLEEIRSNNAFGSALAERFYLTREALVSMIEQEIKARAETFEAESFQSSDSSNLGTLGMAYSA